MASVSEQILQAIETLLGGVGKPEGLRVHRNRALPIQHDRLPALVVFALDEMTARKGQEWAPLAEHELIIRVECRASGNPPDQMLDPLFVWATKTLVGNQTLGGLARSVERIHRAWGAEAGDKIYGGSGVDFVVTYQDRAADPELQ